MCIDNLTAHKSKARKTVDTGADDLFPAETSDDLFSLGSASEEIASSSRSSAPAKPSPTIDYAARFEEHLKFLTDHNGKSPAVRDGKQVSDSIWLPLLGNATSQEDLEKVAKQFKPWKDAGRQIKPRVVELFVCASHPFFSLRSVSERVAL